ncbi:MAG: CTP synthase [Chloroflexi bacterium]|nr:MAG: CTP synthase [Chloroflexota bacterium]
MPKYIFVTGGVVSSVGKGITAASLAKLLKSRGLSVTVQKLDPYLNVDPGTMSPFQHGEVFVTADGAETDLDLGHYERFLDQDLHGASSVTMSQINSAVIAQERRGDHLGGTIQTVPHITDEIKSRVRGLAEAAGVEALIVEIGGTVGDIEGQPFLEAIRQIRSEEPREDTLSIHVTMLPYLRASRELKTKPTQHSVRELRSMGLQPDMIIARAEMPVDEGIKSKIALFCDVEPRAVIPLETMPSIYQVPQILDDAGVTDLVVEKLKLRAGARDLREWRAWVQQLRNPSSHCTIGLVGKYVEFHDSYLSVREALIHAGVESGVDVDVRWVQSEGLEERDVAAELAGVAGIVVPGGFGERGAEGEIAAARWARETNLPYLGLCRGMQQMVIEFARHVLGEPGADSTEFASETPAPVISLLSEQEGVVELGGTMRLGHYRCHLVEGSRAQAAYGADTVDERHRHRWEFNNAYRDALASAGLQASGVSPDGRLVEIAELRDHRFMLGSQFHPELRSRPGRPHPLFAAFMAAAFETATDDPVTAAIPSELRRA